MPSVRTTISCRFFAPFVVLIGAVITSTPAAQAPAAALWSVKIGAAPAAAPVIDGGRVYVALVSGIVAAHDIRNGAELWHREIHTEAPLAGDGGRLVTATSAGVAALNADGTAAWQVPLHVTAPPIAQNGWVIASTAGELVAMRAADGSVVWRTPSDGQRERASIEGDALYVPDEDGAVRALDLATGRERWKQRLGGAVTEVLPFPDRVFAGCADKYFYALEADDGEIAWRTRVGAPLLGKPASDGDRVFVLAFDNLLRAYDRRTGALAWSPRGVPFRPASGPVVAGGFVFVAGPSVEVRVFETAGGKPAPAVKLAQSLATLPAFAASPAGVVMAVITGNLNEQWTLALWGPPPATGSPQSSPVHPR